MGFSKVEIEIDEALVDEVKRKYHLYSTREAVNLALRTLLAAPAEPDDDENDPYGLAALHPRHRTAG